MPVDDKKPPKKISPVTRSRPAPAARSPGWQPSVHNQTEDEMVDLLDEVSLFREMRASLLPALRGLIDRGAPSEEIYKLVESITAARLASEAAFSPEFNLGAARELMDRLHGKATEKKELTHKLEKMRDEELDALLITAVSENEGDDS